jgi:integrase/recombinase XerD
MLTIYRRHLKRCEHRAEGRAYRRCHCPIWVDGFIGKQEIRESLQLRDWQKAQDKVREWEAEGEITAEPEPVTIAAACQEFLKDARARGLQAPTVYHYEQLCRQVQEFAARQGLRYVTELDLEQLRQFRTEWTERNLAARNKLTRLRTFLRFCFDGRWIAENAALRLKSPKVKESPTLPFSRDEMVQVLAACQDYPNKINSVRLRALVLLLGYSGLRIHDAVTLSRERIQQDKLFLYTTKTGAAVWCPLPSIVIEALNVIARANSYFFWNGESKPKSAIGYWQRLLQGLSQLAGVPDVHPHRFRDTFAVELLLSGVPIERVSVLHGHSSIRVTEKRTVDQIEAGAT